MTNSKIETRGKSMSPSNRRAARGRLSLFAGGSLAAATIAVLSAGGAVLAPTAARADNECGNPATNAAAADTFQCTDAAPFAAITYPSTSGNLTLQLQNDVTVTTGGIVITPTGANTVTISRIADSPALSGDPQITSTTGAGISVVRPSGFNGNITVNLSDNDATDTPMSVTGTTYGIRLINAGTGVTTLTTTNGTITATTGVGVQLGTVGTGNTTFTNGSTVSGATGAVQFVGTGNASVSNTPNGVILGKVTFENTGTVTFTNSGVWRSEGESNLGSGTSSLNSSGVLAISGATQGAATLTLSNLETLGGGGRILFGANSGNTATDGVANDRLVTTATMTGAARLEMDVVLGGAQADCSAAVTADCVDLRGGSATGTATILLNPVAGAGAMGVRQVLVDASGAGLVSNGAFALDPTNAGYRADGVIDTGAITYHLINDTAAKQSYLTRVPDREPAQLAHLGETARAAWDMTADAWLGRQSGLRGGEEGGAAVWVSALYGSVANDLAQGFTGGAVLHDTSYRQTSQGLVGGADVFSAEGWKAGVMAGYVTSEVDYVESPASHEMKGYSLGAYGSLTAGGFYADAIASYGKLDVDASLLAAEGEATTFGVQAEAGYRFVTPAGIAVIEPLLALAYVSTSLDEGTFAADGWTIGFDDATSLRGAVGLRLSGEVGEAVTTRFSFTGRVWQEFDGEAGVRLAGGGVADGFVYEDERDVLGDVAFAMSINGLAPGLSLDATARLKMKDNYSAGGIGIGVRYAF